MSPRSKAYRKILSTPQVKGFSPFGLKAGKVPLETVNLLYEEYESIRLCDYEGYDQLRASEVMGISRPTFTRIYAAARQKMAVSLVEGRKFIIEGGKVWFDSSWFICRQCSCKFTGMATGKSGVACPLCGNVSIKHFDPSDFNSIEKNKRCSLKCICPECGFEQDQEFGIPCQNLTCPECGAHLARKKT
ncbi:MAG TPA: DUF134 domain-containing protein [Bacteroidales bacterium]|nr:DUF134 domain-containing protein [Bacteroidales bacterium]